ncbi:hypothetical protein N7G274_000775 [Stereocaulon virgatum]|uniref:Uncharacterized protein n=1 Tax=Stereocaulon virgatum TaxID=373712 RepID=A0ABR4ARF8_9LECA
MFLILGCQNLFSRWLARPAIGVFTMFPVGQLQEYEYYINYYITTNRFVALFYSASVLIVRAFDYGPDFGLYKRSQYSAQLLVLHKRGSLSAAMIMFRICQQIDRSLSRPKTPQGIPPQERRRPGADVRAMCQK